VTQKTSKAKPKVHKSKTKISSTSSQGQCSTETISLLDWQFNLSMRLMAIKIFKGAALAPIYSKRHLPFYQDDS